MEQNKIEILKLIITGFSSIGGYALVSYIYKLIIKRIRGGTPSDIFNDYNKQLKVYIQTHMETISKLNSALDDILDLKKLLRTKDSDILKLKDEVQKLNRKLSQKDNIITTIKLSQIASEKLLQELKLIVDTLACKREDCPNRVKP